MDRELTIRKIITVGRHYVKSSFNNQKGDFDDYVYDVNREFDYLWNHRRPACICIKTDF